MSDIPATMAAVLMDGFGGAEVLAPREIAVPKIGPHEVLIAVHAAGVNRPDVLQRMGRYPAPKGAPDWPGLEVAGVVAAAGKGATRFREGDGVMALLPGGGYAEYASAAEGSAMPIPDGLTTVEAAAFPETFFTVWHNVFQRGALKEGETFLVHGGTSGIGTTAIQLGAAFGATVLTTVGSAAKAEAARRLGASHAFDYRQDDFVEAVGRATGGRGADLILDMVGGDYVVRNLAAAAEKGRIVQIAFLRGRTAELDLSVVMRKRLTFTGSTLRARSLDCKAAIAREIEAEVFPLVASGKVKPLVDTTYPLARAADAHRHMDEDHIGKIVLTTGLGSP